MMPEGFDAPAPVIVLPRNYAADLRLCEEFKNQAVSA
jgi:hypothetical protein